jgi:hypothetical protein
VRRGLTGECVHITSGEEEESDMNNDEKSLSCLHKRSLSRKRVSSSPWRRRELNRNYFILFFAQELSLRAVAF